MNPVQSDKKLFLDNAGVALSNGYIYVGQPGTDPRTNPKTVTFQDAGGSQFTAQQPLRTLGGKIVYNGQPITALVDGEHSLMIRDSADNQVDYSASVNIGAGGSVDLGDTIRVGLVLDNVKAFDVSVGDVVRSVGKLVATDNLGADWLVISATGGSGDDVDLIDFDNGLQGRRDDSRIYRTSKQVWSGSSTQVLVSDLSDSGPGIYMLAVSAVVNFEVPLYARRALTSATPSVWGGSLTSVSTISGVHRSTSTTAVLTTSGGNPVLRVQASQILIDEAGPTFSTAETNATITAIYKM